MNQSIYDTTQPDQNNSNDKLKYFSDSRQFEQPLFKFFKDQNNQPDQNNSNGKLKYFSNSRQFEQPLFRFYQDSVTPAGSMIYGAGGELGSNTINTNTQYTRNGQNSLPNSSKVTSNFDSKYFPTFVNSFATSGDPTDRAKKVNIESEFKIPSHSKKNEIPEFKSTDGRSFKLVHDRRRNLDHSEYIPAGSKTNAGFGNINDFSRIKYGDSTRVQELQGPSRDKELDRFHSTFRNYQHEVYGSNPFPKDTRYLNKKF